MINIGWFLVGFVVGIVGVMIFACLYVSRKAEDDAKDDVWKIHDSADWNGDDRE